ncbi:hypothetical protein NDU88_001929 [Pleurodeles waltl]|uniref:Myb/SANT-like DNA-binding domain-containing protein n=1 Tax=Pleurodeles waltl TaxID=8319 RepID=A0AAV7M4J6_PLEWA|nr:hypothetical protein NDU88_001929 [Pleurodeles waltl]
MARASWERAPAFKSEELEKLVDEVLPQYTLLYAPPDKQVSAHQKKYIWRAIAKDVRTLGVYHRRSTHCRKRWEDIRRWSKKMAEAQLGMASQRGRGARRIMTPLMFRILAVVYPELDGRLRASQQPHGASSGRGGVAPEQEGAASHMALEGDTTDSEFTSGTEGEGSSTAGTGADTSDTDSSSDGRSLVVAATSVPPASSVVPIVIGIWSAPATRAASVARSHSTDSPPPVKHQKLASARRERGKTPATKAAPRGTGGSVDSAATPSKVGKRHKKVSKSGKTAIIPAAQEATATIPAAQEATAIIPAAQEATASTSPAAQEATATSPAVQEATTSTSPAAQEATATSPAAQEATTSTSPAAQEATATSPAAQEATGTSPAAQAATGTSPATQEANATGTAAQEASASTSPAGP